ncbi:MAG: LicD family protein, partial [Bacilli bacterium]|nr:LicD family protein [Bacilli bacterium]
NYVDNSYINILYQYGILVLILITYGYYKLTKKAIKEKDDYLIYILIILYFHSFLNPQLMLISYNLFVLKFVDILLPKAEDKKKNKIDSNEENFMNLKEIHAEQIQMFKKITKYLDKNNLRYFICGGTLLGAIRHKGFIPWDDDIDILMPRPDYDKLQEISLTSTISDNLEVHSFELNNLNDPFCKVYNLDTEMAKYYSEDEYDNHMWIDIFPMDGLPDNEKKIKRIFKKSLRYRRLLKLRKVREEVIIKESKTIIKAITKPFIKVFVDLFPKQFYVKKIDKLCRKYSYDSSKYVGGIAWGYGPQETLLREEVNKIVKVEFENMEVKTFSCWDTYLKNLYNDYMKLPPKEKRIAHVMEIRKIERSVNAR